MKNKTRILVAPLDWGLGHAARCVPLIKELVKQNIDVVIAADNQPLSFLKKEFPSLESIRFPGYNVGYPSSQESMIWKMAVQIPKILSGIKEENRQLLSIIKEYTITGIISDQRFGLYTSLIPCVFITHQVMIKSPFFEDMLYRINKNFIEKYTFCWIPDYPGTENLSGDLSHKFPLPSNASYIGPLTRFASMKDQIPKKKKYSYKCAAILSGPEPQRTIFERLIFHELKKLKSPCVMIKGKADENISFIEDNVEVHSHLETTSLFNKLNSSEFVVSRSGYSTIMDLSILEKKAIVVPTPGQTEQEYLASYHSLKGSFVAVPQTQIDLPQAIEKLYTINYPNLPIPETDWRLTLSKFTLVC